MLCDRCGRENPDGFRFCGACGAPLTAPEGTGFEQERKVISAVFCDLVGFTSRAEVMDPEDVHGLLRTYYASVRSEFEGFGGTVAKFIGDAVFVLFGAPRAHEDDPERAVRAALAGVDAVAELNAAHPDLDLHVHIGVTTGEALITFGPQPDESGGLAWGDILNTAARLEAAAPPDTILVDDATYRATRHAIDYALAEPIHAKGKAEPVPVWQPIAPLTRPGLALGEAAEQPFVSRRAELTLLLGLLDGVRGSRTPLLVTIVGEPGIGKSRLVFELFRRIDEMVDLITFRLGRSPPYPEGVSFWALGEIVKGQIGVLETDGAAAAADKLHAAVRDLVRVTADASRIEGHLRSLVGLGDAAHASGDQRGASFAAWRHFLEALARRRPLVLVFEDIQWADDGSLDFIEHLVGWARDVPILIVATARPELLDRRPNWHDREFGTTLALPPLSADETRELVDALAGDDAMPAEMTDAIIGNASGNPLYSVEFVRMLADRGLLGPSEARRGSTPIETLALPESLRGIIAARLDSLSADDKRLLHAGAVIGRVVWPGALSAITGRSRRWINGRLRNLEDREFLQSARSSSVAGEPEYRFRHVLIRDVAYSEIPRLRRGEIHRKTAEWLSSLSPDRAADRAEMLAHHFQSAYELARTAGGDTKPLVDPARLALRDAGERALSLHAFPAAARFFRAALDLWPPDDPGRPLLLFRLGKSMYYAETAGAEMLDEARDALLAAGDRGTAAEAEAFLANLAYHEGMRHRAFEHLDRAVALVDGLGPTRSRAEVLVDLANYLSLARDHARTIAAAAEALEIARSLGLREVEATALYTIGISRGLSGDLGGRDELRRSIEIAEEIGSHLSAQCCGVLADLEGNVGNLEACFELQARARRHAEAFGHAGFVRWLAGERVGQCYWTGDWDEALRGADALIAEAEAGIPNFMEGYCRTMRGRIRLARADHAGALDDAERAVNFARSAEDFQLLYPALAFRARAEVAVGSLDRGVGLAEELLGLWRSKVDAFPASSWAVDLMWTLDALGRGDEFAEMAERVASPTRWLGALVAFMAGEFKTAAERFGEIGSRPDEAFARLRAAKALLDAGRDHEGRGELRRAVAFYGAVDAATYLRETDALAAGAEPGTQPGARLAEQTTDGGNRGH
jgi:class 3 adenylate cyclase/tetratricopeptide (TPR) repeat protein